MKTHETTINNHRNGTYVEPMIYQYPEDDAERRAVAIAVGSVELAVRTAPGFADKNLRERLTNLFIALLEHPTGQDDSGPRSLFFSKWKRVLRGFVLHKPDERIMRVKGHTCMKKNYARNKVKLHQWEYKVSVAKEYAKTATHVRVFNIIGTISDIVYDKATRRHIVLNEELTGLSKVTISDFLPIKDPFTITLEATLPDEPKLPKTTTVIQAIAFALYKEYDGEYLPTKHGKQMKILWTY